jgi:hypothetical protein
LKRRRIGPSNPKTAHCYLSQVYLGTDIFPGLALTEENPGLYATAYGMLADFVRAVTE